jgi:branched-chain amino acid transport system ATP-binding protein
VAALPSRDLLLSVRDLSIRFGGVTALDSVSFDVEAGQIIGLIGPNGAGKTTVFNCISRLYWPNAGSIRLAGRELIRLRPHEVIRLGVTRTFQSVALFPRMTVLENVLVGDHHQIGAGTVSSALRLAPARRVEREARDRAMAALEMVDLREMADDRPSELPLTAQKRLELARALVSRPRLLLLDEPAAGLNHLEVQQIGDLIDRLRREHDLTVILIEHHLGLVMGLSSHVVVLSFGRKIAEGTPEDVRGNDAVIQAYLGAPSASARA